MGLSKEKSSWLLSTEPPVPAGWGCVFCTGLAAQNRCRSLPGLCPARQEQSSSWSRSRAAPGAEMLPWQCCPGRAMPEGCGAGNVSVGSVSIHSKNSPVTFQIPKCSSSVGSSSPVLCHFCNVQCPRKVVGTGGARCCAPSPGVEH